MIDLFLTQLFTSQDVNWWTGVVWITVMLLSDSHSDGTHSLQSIHCWARCDDTFFQIWSHEQTNSSTSWMAWEWVNFHFWLNYFFKVTDFCFSDLDGNQCYLSIRYHSSLNWYIIHFWITFYFNISFLYLNFCSSFSNVIVFLSLLLVLVWHMS